MERHELTDEQWELVEPLIPRSTARDVERGTWNGDAASFRILATSPFPRPPFPRLVASSTSPLPTTPRAAGMRRTSIPMTRKASRDQHSRPASPATPGKGTNSSPSSTGTTRCSAPMPGGSRASSESRTIPTRAEAPRPSTRRSRTRRGRSWRWWTPRRGRWPRATGTTCGATHSPPAERPRGPARSASRGCTATARPGSTTPPTGSTTRCSTAGSPATRRGRRAG